MEKTRWRESKITTSKIKKVSVDSRCYNEWLGAPLHILVQTVLILDGAA